jgi:arylsulfatase A-like enzyme
MNDSTRSGSESAAGAPESEPRLTPIGVIVIAQWFGLVTGMVELGLLLVRNHFYGTATIGSLQLNRHFPWMIPVAHVLIFSLAGLALVPLAWFWIPRGLRVAFWLLATLSLLGLFLTIPGLYAAACLVLAWALAAWIARRLEARAVGFRRLVRLSLPVLAGSVVALVVLRHAQLALAERWSLEQLPPARTELPNVLLIVMDTVRADRLSLHGYGRDTSPNLVALARRGVKFEHARAAAPWTLPSHACMFTGRWQHELRVFVNRPLDATYPTLAEFLRDHGYVTAGFVANTHFCNSWYGLGRGFIHYEDDRGHPLGVSLAETFRSAELGRRILQATCPADNVRAGETHQRKDAAQINRDFLAWLSWEEKEQEQEQQGKGQKPGPSKRPFFAFLNYYDAHDPYVPPEGFGRRFGLSPTTPAEFALLQSPHVNERLASGKDVTPRDIALVCDAYDDCLAYLDEQLGHLFGALESRGVLENTLVIVTSDHGEHLGEHKLYGHGQSLYRPEIHVPLIVVAPSGVPWGTTVAEPVSLRDLAATVVDHLGLSDQSPFPGRSLARFWDHAHAGNRDRDRGEPAADPVLSELLRGKKPHTPIKWPPALRGPMQAIVSGGKTYIRNGDGIEELYDLAGDPSEAANLAGSPEAAPLLERFRRERTRLLENKSMK